MLSLVPPRLAHRHQSHRIPCSSLLEELADPLSRELTGHNANRSYCLLNAYGVLGITLRVYKTAQDFSLLFWPVMLSGKLVRVRDKSVWPPSPLSSTVSGFCGPLSCPEH